MYVEYKNVPVHRVQGLHIEYGDCTRSMEVYTEYGSVYAEYKLTMSCDTESPLL